MCWYSKAFGSLLTNLFERSLAGTQAWLLFRTTWAARPGFRGLRPMQPCRAPYSEGPTSSLVLCCHSLKVLGNFEQGLLHFHFETGLTNYVVNPVGSFSIYPHPGCTQTNRSESQEVGPRSLNKLWEPQFEEWKSSRGVFMCVLWGASDSPGALFQTSHTDV